MTGSAMVAVVFLEHEAKVATCEELQQQLLLSCLLILQGFIENYLFSQLL